MMPAIRRTTLTTTPKTLRHKLSLAHMEFFLYEGDPHVRYQNLQPYLCDYLHPIPIDRLRSIPRQMLSPLARSIRWCMNGSCNNRLCRWRLGEISEKGYAQTHARLVALGAEDTLPRIKRNNHDGRDVHESSMVEDHEYAESSKNAGRRTRTYAKNNVDLQYDPADLRNASKEGKGREVRREHNGYNDERRAYLGKGKGQQKDDRNARHDSSRFEGRDRTQPTRKTGRHGQQDRGSRNEHPRIPPRRESHIRSSNKRSERPSHRTPQAHIHVDDDDDAYYGSDTNHNEFKIPPPSKKFGATSGSNQKTAKPYSQAEPSGVFDPYAALGLQDKRSAVDQADIEATYKALVRKWHPDRHMTKSKEEQDKATEKTSELNRAYDILGDLGRRKVYDRTGKTETWELDLLVEREANDKVRVGSSKRGGKSVGNFVGRK